MTAYLKSAVVEAYAQLIKHQAVINIQNVSRLVDLVSFRLVSWKFPNAQENVCTRALPQAAVNMNTDQLIGVLKLIGLRC